jgi:hypothetical protein
MFDNQDEMTHFYDDDDILANASERYMRTVCNHSGPFDSDSVTESGLLQEVDEVEETPEEMILGWSYISYAGEPPMDAGAFELWCGILPLGQRPDPKIWTESIRVVVDRLTFNGVDPFACEFA